MTTFVILTCLALLGSSQAQSGCWPTGCQASTWETTGCGQYNMNEVSRTPCPGGLIYQCCPKTSAPAPPVPAPAPAPGPATGGSDASGITFAQFSQATTANGYPAPSQAQYNAYMKGLPRGSITTKQEAAMALANFFQESDGLRAKKEYACKDTGCPGSYATPSCDAPGKTYYGRGYIQLSWCYNYQPCSQDLYGDNRLVLTPELVADDEQTAWDTAFWFWAKRVHNAAGVQQGQFGSTVRAINGGLECDGAYQDKARKRFAMYNVIRTAFGLQGPGNERGCYN